MKIFTSLIKPYLDGPIYQTEYNFDTHKLWDDIYIDINIPFSKDYVSSVACKDESVLDIMYPFFERPEVRAVVYINTEYIVTITNFHIIFRDLSDNSILQQQECLGKFNIEKFVPIGFEKTYLDTRKFFKGPNRVLYDEKNDTYLVGGKWLPNNGKYKFKKHTGKNPYLALIQTGNDAVLVNEDGSYIFI